MSLGKFHLALRKEAICLTKAAGDNQEHVDFLFNFRYSEPKPIRACYTGIDPQALMRQIDASGLKLRSFYVRAKRSRNGLWHLSACGKKIQDHDLVPQPIDRVFSETATLCSFCIGDPLLLSQEAQIYLSEIILPFGVDRKRIKSLKEVLDGDYQTHKEALKDAAAFYQLIGELKGHKIFQENSNYSNAIDLVKGETVILNGLMQNYEAQVKEDLGIKAEQTKTQVAFTIRQAEWDNSREPDSTLSLQENNELWLEKEMLDAVLDAYVSSNSVKLSGIRRWRLLIGPPEFKNRLKHWEIDEHVEIEQSEEASNTLQFLLEHNFRVHGRLSLRDACKSLSALK